MDGWNTIVSFWGPAYFQGRFLLLVSGRLSLISTMKFALIWLGGGNSNIFGMFIPKFGEDEPILTVCIFLRWVGSTTNVGWVWQQKPDPRMALKLQIDGSILGSESLGLIGWRTWWGKRHIGMTYRDLLVTRGGPPQKKKHGELVWVTCYMFFLFSWNMLFHNMFFLKHVVSHFTPKKSHKVKVIHHNIRKKNQQVCGLWFSQKWWDFILGITLGK